MLFVFGKVREVNAFSGYQDSTRKIEMKHIKEESYKYFNILKDLFKNEMKELKYLVKKNNEKGKLDDEIYELSEIVD